MRKILILVLILLGLGLVAPTASSEIIDDTTNDAILSTLEEVALDAIAGQQGIKGLDLELVGASHTTLELTGVTVFCYKAMALNDGTPYAIALDKDGGTVDLKVLFDEEQNAFIAKNGRVQAELAAKLDSASPTDEFDVAIWLEEPADKDLPFRPEPEEDLTQEQVDDFFTALDADQEQWIKGINDPYVANLTARGKGVTGDTHSPIIFGRLSALDILEEGKNSAVNLIFEHSENERMADIARQVVGADQVENSGYTGAGIRVGLTEVGGLIFNPHPYLSATQMSCWGQYLHPHGTYVAGIIQSSHPTIRGAAPGTSILYGGGSTSAQLQCASTQQANRGARTFNLSWGSYSYLINGDSNYYDYMVRDRYRTVVAASGNSGGGTPANPSNAYNIISVGAFDDHDTVYKSDDTMASFSSYRNPNSAHGDRTKPEVAAPGVDINSTIHANPWVGVYGSADGTSYAAPWVTGISALMMQRNWVLSFWPESVKAIMMATAWHNIEGAARLSNRDGAGGVEGNRAVDVAARINGSWGGTYYNCGSAYIRTLTSFRVNTCERTRVAIAWDTNPTYGRYYGSNSQPSADLDLIIRRGSPFGPIVAASWSWDNTYEIVDFTATTTALYYVQVIKYRCSSSPNWLGWAWSK